MSGPRSDRRGDASAGDLARALLGRLDHSGAANRARAVQAWRGIAGDEVARHAMGFAMRKGELVVYTDSAVWAGELTALSEHYRDEINKAVGQELVRSMRFAASKKVGDERQWLSAETAPALDEEDAGVPLVQPLPATREERRQVEAMAAGIHKPELRAAAIDAALRGLEWKKGRDASAGREGAVSGADPGAQIDAGEGHNH